MGNNLHDGKKTPGYWLCLPQYLRLFWLDCFLQTVSGRLCCLYGKPPSYALIMKLIYLILSSLLLTGCLKADIAPTSSKNNISPVKADSLQSAIYSSGTDTSNPDYWYNGTKGTALIQVTCENCSAIATIGTATVPFLFNSKGVGMLKYTPTSGLTINIAVCPGGVKSIKADVFDATNKTLYAYSNASTGNWSGSYTIK